MSTPDPTEAGELAHRIWSASYDWPEWMTFEKDTADRREFYRMVAREILVAGWRRDAVRDAELAKARENIESLAKWVGVPEGTSGVEIACEVSSALESYPDLIRERDALAAQIARADSLKEWVKDHGWMVPTIELVTEGESWLARVRNEAAAKALESAVEFVENLRPEMGSQINVSEYRRGRDDALVTASTGLRGEAARYREGTTNEKEA